MENLQLIGLAFGVGVLIVIQGIINAQLGVRLENTVLASTINLLVSGGLAILFLLFASQNLSGLSKVQSIPYYLLFTGGILSFLAITSFYYVIPKIGIATTVAFGLSGQLIFAAIASHFGWFGLPIEPITLKRIVGIALMIFSVSIIKS